MQLSLPHSLQSILFQQQHVFSMHRIFQITHKKVRRKMFLREGGWGRIYKDTDAHKKRPKLIRQCRLFAAPAMVIAAQSLRTSAWMGSGLHFPEPWFLKVMMAQVQHVHRNVTCGQNKQPGICLSWLKITLKLCLLVLADRMGTG